jgi:hypothetical protein
VLGWKVLSERENEIVIGTGEDVPVGMCFNSLSQATFSEALAIVRDQQ